MNRRSWTILGILVFFASSLVFGQESGLKITLNEVFIHPKNSTKNWVEIALVGSAVSKRHNLELYLSDENGEPLKWRVEAKMFNKYKLKGKNKRRAYVGIGSKGKFYPLPLSTKRYAEGLIILPGEKLYLTLRKEDGTNSIIDSIYIDPSKMDSTKRISLSRLDLEKSNTVKSYAVTKNESNLTMEASLPKKSTAVSVGPGFGTGKFRSTDNPSKVAPGISYNFGIMRERPTRFLRTRIQYGFDWAFVNFSFKNDITDTLTKVVNGEEQVTIRTIQTKGKKSNRRMSFPIILNSAITPKLGLLTGVSLNMLSGATQSYTSDFNYYDAITGALISTTQFTSEEDPEYQFFTAGYVLGAQYILKERHRFNLILMKYNESTGDQSGTGKGNSNTAFFINYQFHFHRSKKRVPKMYYAEKTKRLNW